MNVRNIGGVAFPATPDQGGAGSLIAQFYSKPKPSAGLDPNKEIEAPGVFLKPGLIGAPRVLWFQPIPATVGTRFSFSFNFEFKYPETYKAGKFYDMTGKNFEVNKKADGANFKVTLTLDATDIDLFDGLSSDKAEGYAFLAHDIILLSLIHI